MTTIPKDDGWLILRTQGRHTLRLTGSLAEDGFEVWTPVVTRNLRVPRANVRRDAQLPLMPSYIFARTGHLLDLLELAAMPEKPRRAGGRKPAHPDFTVFRYLDRIPVVADADLKGLREAETDLARPRRRRRYGRGDEVKIPHGSFGGLTGHVVECSGRFTRVCFGTRMEVKISTFILQPVSTYSGRQPFQGTAARAA